MEDDIITEPEHQTVPLPNATGTQHAAQREDIYAAVHKGMRAFMSEVLGSVGRMDCNDPEEIQCVLAQVRQLLQACRLHLDKEDRHIHPALEARRAGSSNRTAADHADHERDFRSLEADVRAIDHSAGEPRMAAAMKLYRHLALFIADNLEHMNTEEIENNRTLWDTYTDQEIRAIHHAIVSSIPPEQLAVFMRWMVPFVSPTERATMFKGMRLGAPAKVFENALALARSHLSERDWHKLTAALAD